MFIRVEEVWFTKSPRNPINECLCFNCSVSGDNKENLPSELDIESIDPSAASTFKPRLFEVVDRPTLQPYAVLLPNDGFQFERGETFLCSEELCQQGDDGYTRTGGLERIIEKLKVRNTSLVRCPFCCNLNDY